MDYARLAKAVEKEDRAAAAAVTARSDGAARGESARVGRVLQPKNRAPAPLQVTAEQLLRESLEFKESAATAAQQSIASPAELSEYRLRKRKEFEDGLRRARHSTSTWLRYAAWEASQSEWTRARSVFERALDVDYRDVRVWLAYIGFEVRHRFVAHARNLFDRAVTLHPRVDALWYRYVHMEELLGDVQAVRAVFARWMAFHPDERAWYAFIAFELRHQQLDAVRRLYQQFTLAHHSASSYVRYARFEERHGEVRLARAVFDLCLKELRESGRPEAAAAEEEEALLLAYAAFEERQREFERARAIYRYALDHAKASAVSALFERYAAFEKAHGEREHIESVVLAKRRLLYEEQLRDNPRAYDAFFDYLSLEQSMPEARPAAVRALFERAVAAVPLSASKRAWKRYIYLWIAFAVWEEVDARAEPQRVREVYEAALALLRPQPFSFAKLWLLYAHFCVRCKDLSAARKALGTALGEVGKDSLYVAYLEMEMSLGEVERCRRLFDRWLLQRSVAADVWVKYAEMEEALEEVDRARRLLELGVGQPHVDRPERLWKAAIDLEIRLMARAVADGNEAARGAGRERVRRLYERLLEQTQHVKVWIAYAQFEAGEKQWTRTRELFRQADDHYRERCVRLDDAVPRPGEEQVGDGPASWQRAREREAVREERALLLSSWSEYEALYGGREQQAEVQQRMPTRLTRKRERRDLNGELLGGWEEYSDLVFPEERTQRHTQGQAARILDVAKRWKQEQERKQRERLEREVDGEQQKDEEQEGKGEKDGQQRRLQQRSGDIGGAQSDTALP